MILICNLIRIVMLVLLPVFLLAEDGKAEEITIKEVTPKPVIEKSFVNVSLTSEVISAYYTGFIGYLKENQNDNKYYVGRIFNNTDSSDYAVINTKYLFMYLVDNGLGNITSTSLASVFGKMSAYMIGGMNDIAVYSLIKDESYDYKDFSNKVKASELKDYLDGLVIVLKNLK